MNNRIIGVALSVTILVCARGLSVHAQSAGPGSVALSGLAVDSLRNVPLPHALIAIRELRRSVLADAFGRFRFDNVPPGQYRITIQHDALDSLGIGEITNAITVDARNNSVVLATPSAAALWRSLCGGSAPRDSGLVFGAIRLPQGQPAAGARVGIAWTEVAYDKTKGFNNHSWAGEVAANVLGRYTVCGVPLDATARLVAMRDSLASGVLDLPSPRLRVLRQDLRLGPIGDTSGLTGIVVGNVTTDDTPVSEASVTVEGRAVRTDASGTFILPGVPVGTRQLEVRSVGRAPVVSPVDILPDDTSRVAVRLSRVNQLEPLTVTATTARLVRVRPIEERRLSGLGHFRDSTAIAKLPNTIAIIDGIAGLKVQRGVGANFRILMPPNHLCEGPVWIDGIRLEPFDLYLLRPSDIAIVEVYERTMFTPREFVAREVDKQYCGAIVVWTKRFLKVD